MTITSTAEGVAIVMAGNISERAVLEVPAISGQLIQIDTAAVDRINSLGVGAWIRYLSKLCEQGVPVVINPLSVALVSQATMISNFLASAKVETFLAPYYCPSCEHSREELYKFQDEVPATIKCPECSEAMEFDDELKTFLSLRR